MSSIEIARLLEEHGLGHALQGFIDANITTTRALVSLTMQDYQSVGVVVMSDRRKLFEAIQKLKREGSAAAAGGSHASPPRESPPPASQPVQAQLPQNSGQRSYAGYQPSQGAANQAPATQAPVARRTAGDEFGPRAAGGSRLTESTGSAEVVMLDEDEEPPTARGRPEPSNHTQYFAALPQRQQAPASQPQQSQPEPAALSNPPRRESPAAQPSNTSMTGPPRGAEPRRPVGSAAARTQSPQASRNTRRRGRITVAVRKRPLSAGEANDGLTDILQTNTGANTVSLMEPKVRVDLTRCVERHTFAYDVVMDETHDNRAVYNLTARDLINTVFEGGNATCFAYGQTGSGKTYTMLGKENQEGVYIMAARDLYANLQPGMAITASFFEIYGGKLYDLLNDRQRVECREDGKGVINVVGLTEHPVEDTGSLMMIIDQGNNMRAAGTTGMNADSSRSHAILQIVIHKNNRPYGRFSFIDLAGSERGADTMESDLQTRREGAEINKSLLALKECIRALDQSKRHIPFRGSKLTAVLRDSFIGNSRTVMIGNISPASGSCEHTLNTLRYADRVKELRKDGRERHNEAMLGQVPTEQVEVIGGGGKTFAERRAEAARAARTTSQRTTSQPPQPRGDPSRPRQSPSSVPAAASARPRANTAAPRSPASMQQSSSYDFQGGGSPAPVPNTVAPEPSRRPAQPLDFDESGSDAEPATFQQALERAHRAHVDKLVATVRQELASIPKPGVDDGEYHKRVDAFITLKQQQLQVFRRELAKLREEYDVEDDGAATR